MLNAYNLSCTMELRTILRRNEILVHVDYSKNYESKHQREIQIAYFGHTSFSIFTACCYLCNVDEKIICESVTVTSELPYLSRSAAITCVPKVNGKSTSIFR